MFKQSDRKMATKLRNWIIIISVTFGLTSLLFTHHAGGIVVGVLVGTALSIYITIGMICLNRLRWWEDVLLISLYIFSVYLTVGILLGSLSDLLLMLITSIGFDINNNILMSLNVSFLTAIVLLYSIESKYLADRFFSPHHRFIKFPGNLLIVCDIKNLLVVLTALLLSSLSGLSYYFVKIYVSTPINICLLVIFYFIVGVSSWIVFKKHSLKITRSLSKTKPTEKLRNVQDRDIKVILIGLDGLTWEVINPLLKEGKLPNIEKLMKNGSYGYLQTLEPTLTPVIWTSIATGKLPNKHWVTNFLIWNIKGVKSSIRKFVPHFGVEASFKMLNKITSSSIISSIPVTSESWNSKSLWEILSENDKKVGVVGWYPTWPSYTVNGYLVTDRAHCLDLQSRFYPESLEEEVKDLIALPHQYHLSFKRTVHSLGPITDGIDQFINFLENVDYSYVPVTNANRNNILEIFKFEYLKDKTYMNIGKYVLKNKDLDFFAIYLHGTDAVAHCFWKWREPEFYPDVNENEIRMFGNTIDKYYIYMDSFIGELLKNVDEKTIVIIVSDHGEKALYGGHGRHKFQSLHDISTPGVIIMHGDHIKGGKNLDHATVLDITPTILYLMGFPIGKDMDGKVLINSIERDFLNKNPIHYIDSYEIYPKGVSKPSTSYVDEQIKQHLRALGYL